MALKQTVETALMKQYNAIKAKYLGALLLFRVGDFYETFGEDAIMAARFDHSNRVNVRPQDRSIGMVFQNYSLFPKMTVHENLVYALPKGQSTQLLDELLETT